MRRVPARALGWLLFASATPWGGLQASTLVYCSEASPEGFNPAFYTSLTTWDASSKPLFNRLVQFAPGTLKIVPALAESWEVSEDGLVYTFKLRRGVPFHRTGNFSPTREFNADDVIFSVNRLVDRQHPYHDVGRGVYPVFESLSMGEIIRGVEKVDEYAVRFRLSEPLAPFLSNLAMDFMSIHSAQYAEQLMEEGSTERFDLAPVGTGPFVLETYRQDASIRYRSHPGYWAGAPAIDTLVFDITPDASVRLQKLLAGECHVMAYPNPADLQMLRAHADVVVEETPGHNIGYLAFHTGKPPLDRVEVRRALTMAIDREAIMRSVYLEQGIIAHNPLPPTLDAWNDSIPRIAHDPDQARALLASVGLADGFPIKLWAMPVQRAYNPNARRMAELIQEDWRAIGVAADIVSYEWGEYISRSRHGEHEALLLGWSGQTGDPDNFLYTLLSCASVLDANRARWCDETFDGLIHRARRIADPARRDTLYRQAQAVFHRQLPWAPIAHSKVFVPVRKEVRGYRIDPLGGQNFADIELVKE